MECGISQLMSDLYRNFGAELSEHTLFQWHRMLLVSDQPLQVVGRWRKHADRMQVVLGPDYKRKVHFEALPSERVPEEMRLFIAWFNQTAPGGDQPWKRIQLIGELRARGPDCSTL